MSELAHFLRDLDDHDDEMEQLAKEWTFVKEATSARQHFPAFFPHYAAEVNSSKPSDHEEVQSLNDNTNLDSLLGNDSTSKASSTNFFAKFELSLYVHEVSKLLLHHKDVNKLYTNMKHEYLSYNNLKDDKLPSSTGTAGSTGPMDTTQHANNALGEVLSIAFDNTMFHLFPHHNTQYQVRQRPDFLYHHQSQASCYDIYVSHKDKIVQEILAFHRDVFPVLNDVFCYPHSPMNPADTAAAANGTKEKMTKSFEEFTYGHAAIQDLYKRIFVESGHAPAKTALPPFAAEMSQTFFHALLHNVRVVIFSLPRQRKTFAYNPMTCDLAKALPNDNSCPQPVSAADAASSHVRKEHDFDVVFVNSRHLFASARLYNTNANRLMKNAKDRDLYYDRQRYEQRHVAVAADEDATQDYLCFTREYNNTVLQEIELIQVSRRIPHAVPQYIRSGTIHFNENKKKNDVNTSTVLKDNTFLFSSLFARYARENLNPTLYRNILTSKKLGLNYYTTDPYVVLGLFTLFLSEAMKYPSYLLIHAMILDLMDSSSNGTSSATASLSSASGEMGAKGLTRPTSSFNTSFYGGVVPSNGPAKLNWLKLVPRKRLEGPVVMGGAAAASEGVEKASVERNEKTMQMLHDYMSKDVLIPIAIENYEEGNKELLALYNACSTMPYVYDDECKLTGEHRPRSCKAAWEMKELLINKENQIITEWLSYRCINYQPPLMSADPSQHAYYYQKTILPKFNELCIKWYGLSLYDTFDQLKL